MPRKFRRRLENPKSIFQNFSRNFKNHFHYIFAPIVSHTTEKKNGKRVPFSKNNSGRTDKDKQQL